MRLRLRLPWALRLRIWGLWQSVMGAALVAVVVLGVVAILGSGALPDLGLWQPGRGANWGFFSARCGFGGCGRPILATTPFPATRKARKLPRPRFRQRAGVRRASWSQGASPDLRLLAWRYKDRGLGRLGGALANAQQSECPPRPARAGPARLPIRCDCREFWRAPILGACGLSSLCPVSSLASSRAAALVLIWCRVLFPTQWGNSSKPFVANRLRA